MQSFDFNLKWKIVLYKPQTTQRKNSNFFFSIFKSSTSRFIVHTEEIDEYARLG